jgi:hypothetical protein
MLALRSSSRSSGSALRLLAFQFRALVSLCSMTVSLASRPPQPGRVDSSLHADSGARVAGSLEPDLNLVAIRIGDVRVGETGSKLAAPEQSPSGALDFRNGAVDVVRSTSRKPKCATPPTAPVVVESSANVRMSRLVNTSRLEANHGADVPDD